MIIISKLYYIKVYHAITSSDQQKVRPRVENDQCFLPKLQRSHFGWTQTRNHLSILPQGRQILSSTWTRIFRRRRISDQISTERARLVGILWISVQTIEECEAEWFINTVFGTQL